MSKISPLAYIDPAAKIGENVEIGPFCYIDKNVEIGDNNVLMNSVTILYGARIGQGNIFFPGAVISAIPQDLKFRGEETLAIIGDNNKIRENVTINRGTAAKGQTVVGSGCLLMEGCHVAHDAIVGNDVIIGNSTKLAGEIIIDDHAILSAGVLLHQFCRIGSYTMVGGGTRSSQNVVPYSICARDPAAYCGLNIVGLRRRGFEREVINTIHEAYRLIFNAGLGLQEAIDTIKAELPETPEIKYILEFIEYSKKRGFCKT
ncbi:MAG: acyl-ACP--UDP-N-acetylglucosamine O-acyltransferase [Bacteroidaceae bacterium]|nr:acyl-ACP--UDP-N-acetylglucosamine O-acyltransferase [Bacteroidaceae bacterium]